MITKFLDSERDMGWLQDVHFKHVDINEFESAILYGNEDAPSKVKLYKNREPLITDGALVFVPDDKGVLNEEKVS